MTSHHDLISHSFTCLNAKCGNQFEETLSRLTYKKVVFCPKCGQAQDIRESKSTGEIGLDFDMANQLDALSKKPK